MYQAAIQAAHQAVHQVTYQEAYQVSNQAYKVRQAAYQILSTTQIKKKYYSPR